MSSPFEPPATPNSTPIETSDLVGQVHAQLVGARPFQLVVAGVMGLAAGGMLGLGLLSFVLSLVGGNSGGVCGSMVYIVVGAVFMRPVWSLWESTSAIAGPDANGLQVERALRAQTDFWRITGAIAAGLALLYGLALAFLILAAIGLAA